MKKFTGIFLAFIFSFSALFSQQILDEDTASWSFVMPGKLICDAKNTSYGFICLDDSRLLSAYNFEGKKLWDKSTGRGTAPDFSVLPNDFVLLLNHKGKQLQLLNPTGTELWTQYSDFEITEPAFAGRDGRFFVKGQENISSYGLNGIKKWTVSIKNLSSQPLIELNDGSLAVFSTEKNSTYMHRISPFGEVLEIINLKNNMMNATECEKGILVCFENGEISFYSVDKNKTYINWNINYYPNEAKPTFHKFIVSTDSSDIFYARCVNKKLEICKIDISSGKINSSFTAEDFSFFNYANLTSSGLLLADSLHTSYFNYSGLSLWNGNFISSKKKNLTYKTLYNAKDFLIVFSSDWNAYAYKVTQTTSTRRIKQIEARKIKYESFYNIDESLYDDYYMQTIDSDVSDTQNIDLLKGGDYGQQEKPLLEKLLSGCKAYEGILFTKNSRTTKDYTVFERDNAGLEKMINQMPLFGIDTFTNFIAYIINYETNRTILNTALISITENGYDPDGKLLKNLYLLAKRTNIKDTTVPIEICDAVYSICKFMGKPAFNKQGKEIITTFLYPQFNVKAKEYARETFKKISALDL